MIGCCHPPPTHACLDRRAVANASLLDLQRGDHRRLMPHVVLARAEFLGEERLSQRLEPARGQKKRGEIVSQSPEPVKPALGRKNAARSSANQQKQHSTTATRSRTARTTRAANKQTGASSGRENAPKSQEHRGRQRQKEEEKQNARARPHTQRTFLLVPTTSHRVLMFSCTDRTERASGRQYFVFL